jgi:hypothetical protein
VLFLVGARIRVLALRRRKRAPAAGPQGWRAERHHGERHVTERAFDDDFDDPELFHAHAAPERDHYGAARDEWAFPDPSEPAPTGLLPSTASARRQAREPAMAGDPD